MDEAFAVLTLQGPQKRVHRRADVSGCSEHYLRIDYLDIDGAVLFSDSVACAEDEAKLSDDERVWDLVFLGIKDEDATEVGELGRISRVTEVDRDPPP